MLKKFEALLKETDPLRYFNLSDYKYIERMNNYSLRQALYTAIL